MTRWQEVLHPPQFSGYQNVQPAHTSSRAEGIVRKAIFRTEVIVIMWRRHFFHELLILVICATILPAASGQSVTLSMSSINFGNVVVGTTSAVSKVTLTNSGTAALNMTGISASASFGETNNCVSPLAPKGHCLLSVTFSPTALGLTSGTLTISDNAGSGTQSVSLKGFGVVAATLLPTSFSFGSIVVGVTSTPQTATLTNNQSVPLNISSIAASSPFAVSASACGAQVLAKGTCKISVTFTPAALGTQAGKLTVNDDALNSPAQSVNLSGTGSVAVTLSPTSFSFGSIVIGVTSAPQTATLTNNQNVPLNISSIAASGPFAVNSNTCGAQVLAKNACKISVTFTPATLGTQTGQLTINDDGVNSPTQSVSLSGNGLAAKLVSVAISPGGASLPLGTKQQFKAVGSYNNNTTQDLTNSATWSSSAVAVATIGNLTGTKGLATSLAQGSTTITAKVTSSGATFTSSASLTVTPPALVSITVSPANQSVAAGGNLQFTANGAYTNGTSADITSTASWSSSDPTVATVTGAGSFHAVAQGTVTVTAVSGTISGTAGVTVTPKTLSSIAVTPSSPTIQIAGSQQFTAVGTYSDTSTADLTASASWASTNPAVATVSAGLAQGVATGMTVVSAMSGGVSGSTNLTVAPRSLVSISVTPGNATINNGATQQYTATGTYSDGSTADITSTSTWASTNFSSATIDSTGLASSIAAGGTTISAVSGSISGSTGLTVSTTSACQNANSIDMNLLVVTNGMVEADYPAITTTLNYLGTPYTVFDMNANPAGITSSFLYSGCHAFFQGVILANGGYIYTLPGANLLASFESIFGIRQVNWFTYPGSDFGFNFPTGTQNPTATPYNATFTSGAQSVFPYATQTTPVPITYATIYQATAQSGTNITPLLTDAAGNSLAIIEDFGQGRQYLTLTFDSNQYLTHNLVLSYGLVNWVTQGLFIGEKHIYFTPQEDDWGIDDHQWQATTPCGTPSDDNSLPHFRIAAADANAFVAWQNTLQTNPMFSQFKLYNAFNGFGFTTGAYTPDDLTPWTSNTANSVHFGWINHTFNHTNMNQNSIALDSSEISQNVSMAATMGFINFNPANMVTPDISGLNDANFLQAAVNNGVKYLVTDTSRTAPNNGPGPGFNLPIVNSIQPTITEIPRRPNNLFFNVGDPGGWVQEYDCIYTGHPPYGTFDYQHILDNIAQSFVAQMLQGDADPEMFHQTNLAAYDNVHVHSVLSDLLDDTFTQYQSYFNLPVKSVDEDQLGQFMLNNLALKNSVRATVNNSAARTITITVQNAATVPVTGLQSAGAESYGGQSISHIPLTAGQTVTVQAP